MVSGAWTAEETNDMKGQCVEEEGSDMDGQWTEEERFMQNIWFRELGLQRRGMI